MKKYKLIIPIIILICLTGCDDTSPYYTGYEEGYQHGYENGISVGYSDGVSEYEGSGYDTGYEEGYQAAIDNEENIDYTLLSNYAYYKGFTDGITLSLYEPDNYVTDYECYDYYWDGYENGYTWYVDGIEGSTFDYSIIPMIPVNSSFINSIGYSDYFEKLIIDMNKTNNIYVYDDVPSWEFIGLLDNKVSPGEQFNNCIKDKYTYTKIK